MRTTTFENLGTKIDKSTTLVDGLPKDFCFGVKKQPLFYTSSEGELKKLSGTSTIVNVETQQAYGPVSDKYCPIDNATALGPVAYMDGLTLKKYGSTEKGVQWLIGELEHRTILGDDFAPHLVFRNSFDGSTPIQMAIMPLRIVCQNQITMATKTSNISFNLRHTSTAMDKIEEGHRLIIKAEEFMKDFAKRAEELACVKVGERDVRVIIENMFPTDGKSELQAKRLQARKDDFIRALNSFDNANFKGTAWGIVNAHADLMTHYEPERKTKTSEENKFMSVTFDQRWMGIMLNLIASTMARKA